MNDIVLFSKNSKEYAKLVNPWDQKPYNVLLSGNKCKSDKIIRVSMNKNKIENTFFTALLYGIKLNGMLEDKKKEYIEKEIKEHVEQAQKLKEVVHYDSKIVSDTFLDSFKTYMQEQQHDETTVQILQLIFNLFKDEEIHEYFEGTFADDNTESYNSFESEEELKDTLLEIFSELKETHIQKIDKIRTYTSETKKSYNRLIDNSFDDFLVYFLQNVETKTTETIIYNTLNLKDNLELYYTLMKADETLPNIVIINSETLSLDPSQSFEKDIDPNRKCIVLFHFQQSNEFERLVYETYMVPPLTFRENNDYILKRKQNDAFYRMYTFPYEHCLIQNLSPLLK